MTSPSITDLRHHWHQHIDFQIYFSSIVVLSSIWQQFRQKGNSLHIFQNRGVDMRAVLALLALCYFGGEVYSLTEGPNQSDYWQYGDHDYNSLVKVLQEVNRRCPNITRTYELSKRSVQNRSLMVIEFTSNGTGKHQPGKIVIVARYYGPT